jgi:moderate conductance mechanosensitive channel
MTFHWPAVIWSWFDRGDYFRGILQQWGPQSQAFIRDKVPHLIAVVLIAFLLIQLLRVMTRRMTHVAERHAVGAARLAEVRTLAGVIRATGLAVIAVITGLQFLAAVGVNLAPLLASAGVAGIAIGLAAQTIVKDVLNGMLILVEGQFNVGDKVTVAGVTGIVENITLRKTSVRDPNGSLCVVPNSQITTVINFDAGYSVATVNVSVDFSAHPDEVTALLKGVALEVRNSDEYKPVFAEDPQVLGVDAVKGSEMIYPVVFKTLANKQFAPVREFRRRVRLALEEHHLLPGDPYRVFRPSDGPGAATGATQGKAASAHDPTTIKPQSSDPFTEN